MQAFLELFASVFGWKSAEQRRLEAAQKRWREAGEALQAAMVRGDTRTIGAAKRAHKAAAHEALRLELGR